MARLIALISGSYRPDRCGVADYTRRLAEALVAARTRNLPAAESVGELADRGFRPVIVTSVASQDGTIPSPFPPVLPLVGDWRLRNLPGLARRLLQWRPDIVHIQHAASSYGQSRGFGLFPLMLKAMAPRIPLVVTAHEYGGWRAKPSIIPAPLFDATGSWLERRGLADREDLLLLSLSQAIIVTNQYHFDYIRANVPGVADKLRLVPIGPNVVTRGGGHDPARSRVFERFGWSPESSLICYFGFIHPVKGLESLLRAFHALSRRLGPTHLVVIGGVQSMSLTAEESEGYYQKLLDLKDELGLNDRVTFTGYLPDDQVSELLQAADVGVLPFNHGISLKSGSLLAATAHGLPVLATRTEATSPELKDEANILLVPPRDTDALTAGLERLLSTPGLRMTLREGALALSQRFSWKEIADEHAHLYNRMLRRE